MTVPGLIAIRKVRVEKLLSPGPGGWGSRQFKVNFRAGAAAGETLPKQPNPDGSIEWVEVLEIPVYDTEESLIASVVSRSGYTGTWRFVPGGRFEGFPVKVLPAVWSETTKTGTTFRAEIMTYINGAEGGAAEPPRPSMDNVEEHEGRQYFPAAAAGDAHAGLPHRRSRRSRMVEDSIHTSAGGGPPGWGPAAAGRPFARTQPGELPVSTAVSVAAELVPHEAAGAATAVPHASAATRGGSMYTTPSARRHSALIARSSSGGFLTRDGSLPGRSREGSWSSFHLARGSSRSLGESLAGSSSQDDSAPRPLPSPVGTPSVSRLMDDNFRLEENENEDSQAFSTPPEPSVPAWGEPALQLASAPAALPAWGDDGAGRSGAAPGSVQAGWADEVTNVTLTTTTGVAPFVRPGFIDDAQSAGFGGPLRLGGIYDTRSAQQEEREEPSIHFSPAYGALDSPAPPPQQPRRERYGPFSIFKRKPKKRPDVTDVASSDLALHGARGESGADVTMTSAPLGQPSRPRFGIGGPLRPRPVMGAGRAPGARGRAAGRLDDTLDERRIPTRLQDTDTTVPSRGASHRMTSGRSRDWVESQGSDDSQRPIPGGTGEPLMHFARQEAAAPASEEPAFASPPSPREMMAQPTVPTAPPPPHTYEEGLHGYDHPQSLSSEFRRMREPAFAESLLRPASSMRASGHVVQGMGALPGTAGAESPQPPSYDDIVALGLDGHVRPVHDLPSFGSPQPEEKHAKSAEAMEEFLTYDHPGALGSSFGDEIAGRTVEQRTMMPASLDVDSIAHGPSASERGTTYPEGGTSQHERQLETAPQPWPETRAPPVFVAQRLSASRADLARGAIQPLGEDVEMGSVQSEQEVAAERATESAWDDHTVDLELRDEHEDAGHDEERYSAMPANRTARSTPHGSNGFHGRVLYPEGRMPGDEERLAVLGRPATRTPRAVPRSFSVREVESATRAIQPLGRVGDRETADPVCFSCLSPRSVWGGREFELNVLAYLPQSRDEVLQRAQTKGEVEAGLPGGMSIMRGKRVTVNLNLPVDVFEVLGSEGNSQVSHHRPSVRDFVWNGTEEGAVFRVQCRRGAAVGSVRCGAYIIEGSRVTSLSFFVEVVETEDAFMYADLELLDTKTEAVKANVAVIDPDELTISDTIIGRGVQGETFKGIYRGEPVAIKRLKQSSAPSSCVSEVYGLRHEATILSLLGHHPNIVEFHGLSRRGGGFGDEGLDVVTKFEAGGNLQDALGTGRDGNGRTNGGTRHAGMGCDAFSGSVRTAWARDLARGLANSHAAGVLHNDVASRNALRSSWEVGAPVLLCDFAMSRILRGDGVEKASLIDVGGNREKWPLRQMPKESLEKPFALSEASDAWMYGTLLYEIFEGKEPFCGTSPSEVQRLILEGKTLDPPDLLKDQGLELEKVFRRCLQVDHAARPSMEEIVATLSS